MQKRRILLLSAQPLLSEGLAALLGQEADVELLGPHDLAAFTLDGLAALHPDAVLLAAGEADPEAVSTLTLRLLREYPDLPVIHVGLSEHPMVRVFTSHILPARRADLLATIRSLPAGGATVQHNGPVD